ncbi:MAG: hypothetical protein M3Y33_16125 [Actinomycetota bacterium]|nr:hypothetical protein [Actinomycetota bacterium]
MPVGDLEASCEDLLAVLDEAGELIWQPDDQGTTGRAGKPGSRPPWNPMVANVLLDAHEGSRRLEAALRYAKFGHPGWRRGGADRHTAAALKSAARLAAALGPDAEDAAQRIVDRWATSAKQLPAIDEAPVWRSLRPGPEGLPPVCRFCATYNLRVAVTSRTVMCFSPACPGARPTATMDRLLAGPEAGKPLLKWSDGWIDYGPAAEAAHSASPVPGEEPACGLGALAA